MKLEVGFLPVKWVGLYIKCKFSKYEWSTVKFSAASQDLAGMRGRVPTKGQSSAWSFLIPSARVWFILRAKKEVEKVYLIFCRFSKISDLSSPLGKRNGMFTRGLSKATAIVWSIVQEEPFSRSTNMLVFSMYLTSCQMDAWDTEVKLTII